MFDGMKKKEVKIDPNHGFNTNYFNCAIEDYNGPSIGDKVLIKPDVVASEPKNEFSIDGIVPQTLRLVPKNPYRENR